MRRAWLCTMRGREGMGTLARRSHLAEGTQAQPPAMAVSFPPVDFRGPTRPCSAERVRACMHTNLQEWSQGGCRMPLRLDNAGHCWCTDADDAREGTSAESDDCGPELYGCRFRESGCAVQRCGVFSAAHELVSKPHSRHEGGWAGRGRGAKLLTSSVALSDRDPWSDLLDNCCVCRWNRC